LGNKIKISDLITNSLEGKLEKEKEQLLNDFVQKIDERDIDALSSEELSETKQRIQRDLYRNIKYSTRKRRQRFVWFGVASVFLLFGILYWSQETTISKDTNYLTFATSKAIDSIQLSDNSMVYLKENSKLIYPDTFENQENREVSVSGEAFFKVTKNPKHPFIVKSQKLTTKVLGTSFGFISRDSVNEVIVVTGKVRVSSNNQKVILLPNQKVQLQSRGKLLKSDTNASLNTLWTQQYQSFDEESLENITMYLESRFAIKFLFEQNEIKNYKMKVRFENKDSLLQILNKIKFITSINYKIKNNEVKLLKK
jgi:transmembrane sensor